MIQDIFKKLTPELISGLTEQIGLSKEKSEETIGIARESLASTIGKEAAGGKSDEVLNMFNQGGSVTQSPIFQKIMDNLIGNLTSKLGISEDKAKAAASFVLPKIVNAISGSKSGDLEKTDIAKIAGEAIEGSIGKKADSFLKGGIGNLFK